MHNILVIKKAVKLKLSDIYEKVLEIHRWCKFQKAIQSGMISIGQGTFGQPEIICFPGDRGKVIIGNYCSIASGVKVFVGGNPKETHNMNYISTYPFPEIYHWTCDSTIPPQGRSGVTIGHDVWIGVDVLIMHGVTIGDGSVIGARSVVVKDVPPYSIVAGNPCNLLRKRFDDETIELLLKLQWWNWNLEKIKREVNFIYNVASKEKIKEYMDIAD